ncbi:hypothetical protein C0V77_05210 [Emticicia sp. TH156]|nr:hypothetical protein C0V77_05210 [Emticicia sp. TH156]
MRIKKVPFLALPDHGEGVYNLLPYVGVTAPLRGESGFQGCIKFGKFDKKCITLIIAFISGFK